MRLEVTVTLIGPCRPRLWSQAPGCQTKQEEEGFFFKAAIMS